MSRYYNFTNATTPDGVLVGLSDGVPAFPIMILVFVWFFVFLGGTQRQNARYGYADMSQWAVMASLTIFLFALIMTISVGMIGMDILAVTIGLLILTATWFFLSKGRSE